MVANFHALNYQKSMTLLSKAIEEKKTDRRMVERFLSKGQISHDEVRSLEKALPDDAESADWTNIEELAAMADAPTRKNIAKK